MEELQGIHYDAFISYRHSELDSFVAENLHRRLEAFKLPRSVRSKVKSGKKYTLTCKVTVMYADKPDETAVADILDILRNARRSET